jgi:endonuclease/exonuclease/phosphatase family metal-dependent hydrolase
MEERQVSRFRLMTYNLRRITQDLTSNFANILEIIETVSPDILVIQEAIAYQDAGGDWHSNVKQFLEKGTISKYHLFLGPTLSMRENFDVRQSIYVEGKFKDWRDWRYGNAILSRWDFVRFGDPSKPGQPRNIPLHRVPLYLGNRDTEPRYALVGRVNCSPFYPFVIGVHFLTLLGERGQRHIPGKAEEVELLRVKQARRLLDLLRRNVLQPRELAFLLGDFNAAANELCISAILEKEGGFMRLVPQNNEVPTHPRVADPIDHIFVFPPERVMEYECWIIDSPMAKKASNHLPVMADVVVKNL